MLEIYFSYRDFNCSADKYREDIEFTRIEETQPTERFNCHWYRSSTGAIVVWGVDLRDPGAQIVVQPRGFAIRPRYKSVFLSYGSPDEAFARRIYRYLRRHHVETFFFPEAAVPGRHLHRTMIEGVTAFDRVVLLCSKTSLTRAGVLYEIEQVLAREAREGGAELLIPVALDNHLFTDWAVDRPHIASQLRSRVVADFQESAEPARFRKACRRLLTALL